MVVSSGYGRSDAIFSLRRNEEIVFMQIAYAPFITLKYHKKKGFSFSFIQTHTTQHNTVKK